MTGDPGSLAATIPMRQLNRPDCGQGLSWYLVGFNPTSWSSAVIYIVYHGAGAGQSHSKWHRKGAFKPVDKSVIKLMTQKGNRGKNPDTRTGCTVNRHGCRATRRQRRDQRPGVTGADDVADGDVDPAPGATPSTASDSPCRVASAAGAAGFNPAATTITSRKIAPSPVKPRRSRSPLRGAKLADGGGRDANMHYPYSRIDPAAKVCGTAIRSGPSRPAIRHCRSSTCTAAPNRTGW